MEFVKLPNSTTFAILKMNYNTEVCSVSSFPTEEMMWITEFDSAKGRNEMTSFYFMFGRIISDIEALHSSIASVAKKLLTADFKRRVNMEEQKRHSRTNDSFKGRQIEYITHDHFKISCTGETLLDFNDFARVHLKSDKRARLRHEVRRSTSLRDKGSR